MYQRKGEKSGSHGNQSQQAHAWPPGDTCVHLGGRVRRSWEKRVGKAMPGLGPPATTSQVMVGDGICNSWECGGFSWRPFSILTLFLEPLGVPFMLTGALSGRYVFLWNVTFSRDRGWQRCDQGAFILLLIPTDALLSP